MIYLAIITLVFAAITLTAVLVGVYTKPWWQARFLSCDTLAELAIFGSAGTCIFGALTAIGALV